MTGQFLSVDNCELQFSAEYKKAKDVLYNHLFGQKFTGYTTCVVNGIFFVALKLVK